MAAFVKNQVDFWISAEFFAVGLSAFIGVAIRVAIENYFANSEYSPAYGAFTQLFYSSTYLLPNLLGCFIMSVCIANMKALTDISTPLYKFLTTGLCGCITTYSSWLNVTVNQSFDKYEWYGMPVRILVEFWLTWGVFTFGFTFQKLCVEFMQSLSKNEKKDDDDKAKAAEKVIPVVAPSPAPVTTLPAPPAPPAPAPVDDVPPPTDEVRNSESIAKGDLKGSIGSVGSTGNPMQAPAKITQSKRSSTVRFAGGDDDDMRMLSHDEANALEAELARANTAANAGPPRPGTGRASTFGRVSAFVPNGRSSTLGMSGRSSTMGLRNSTFGVTGDTGRVSSWGRGSMAPSRYDKNSLYAVQEDIVFNDLAGRISVWREDGILDGENTDNRKSLAFRARNSMFKGSTTRQSSAAGLDMALSPAQSFSLSSDPESATLPVDIVEAVKEDTPFIKFVLFCIRNEYYIWCSLFCITAFILWSILAAGKSLSYFDNQTNYNLFRSVCLAPFGAWVRWAPTRLPWIKAYWPEMNPQTFIVNQLAVFVMVCLLVFIPNYSWTDAIDNGFNGSCSTVSTFFAELHTLYFEKGPSVAIRYGIVTFAVSIALIQLIRGANTP